MKLKINYIDNEINLTDDIINSIEIENKGYFYRLVMDLYNISNSLPIEDIIFHNDMFNEINYLGKIKLFFNYFDFEFNSKKYNSDINRYISTEIGEEKKDNIIKQFNKLIKIYNTVLNNTELPLIINSEIEIDNITKLLKINIDATQNLLTNIFLIIDLEKTLKYNNILFFINLKQYLNNEELDELYKYSIYNQVKIILIDSQAYKERLKYEKKLTIDNNLEESMI